MRSTRTGRAWALLMLLTVLGPLAARAAGEDYDVLIRHGRLLDGTGNPWRLADVAIKDGRIAAVGTLAPSATAASVVDATGRYVAPGFIDVHSHAAPGIETAGLAAAEPILYQGASPPSSSIPTAAGRPICARRSRPSRGTCPA